jgi:hypothetical protein
LATKTLEMVAGGCNAPKPPPWFCRSDTTSYLERQHELGIAKRVSISPTGLLRHKKHLSESIVKAAERREEHLDDSLLDEMRRVQRKAWELLSKTESEGDYRGSIVALREVRECLEWLGDMLARSDMLAKADAANLEPVQHTIKFADASICPSCGGEWERKQ